MSHGNLARVTKKRFTLRGESAEELERRIRTFRSALGRRHGSILRIKPKLPMATRWLSAVVYYQLPVASLRAEAPVVR